MKSIYIYYTDIYPWLRKKPADEAVFIKGWVNVDIPHDWLVEGNFTNEEALRYGGYYPRGFGCYRKIFEIRASEIGRKIFIEFDGIFINSTGYASPFNFYDYRFTVECLGRSWNKVHTNPHTSGVFYWTGFDYRDEPSPFECWPAVVSQYGTMDLCGFPKDNFHYYRSIWTDKPMIHILPHWNWTGKEGREITVWTFSNCDTVELFLTEKVLEKKG